VDVSAQHEVAAAAGARDPHDEARAFRVGREDLTSGQPPFGQRALKERDDLALVSVRRDLTVDPDQILRQVEQTLLRRVEQTVGEFGTHARPPGSSSATAATDSIR